MPLAISTHGGYLEKIAARLDTGNVFERQYLDKISFAQQLESAGNLEDALVVANPGFGLFAQLTGISAEDSFSLLHGIRGDKPDTRDWAAIMASDDPLTAARQATAAMLGTPAGESVTTQTDALTGVQRTQAGNFAVQVSQAPSTVAAYSPSSEEGGDTEVAKATLYLVDGQGQLRRNAGNTAQEVAHTAWLFGVDASPLSKLASAIQEAAPQLAVIMQQAAGIAPSVAALPPEVVAASTASASPAPAIPTTPTTTTGITTSTTPLTSAERAAVAENAAQALLDLLNSLKNGVTA